MSWLPPRWPFVRDAAVVAVIYGTALALYQFQLGPSFLQIPGQLLYLPFLVLYIRFGGELVNDIGPSPLQMVVYVLVVGLVTAWVAHLLRGDSRRDRQYVDQVTVGAALAVVVLAVAVVGVVGFPFIHITVWGPLVLVGGVAGIYLALRRRRG
jgi:hypothetical protein